MADQPKQLPNYIAPHLTSPEWRRCALIEIELLKLRIKNTQEELQLWEKELIRSDQALTK